MEWTLPGHKKPSCPPPEVRPRPRALNTQRSLACSRHRSLVVDSGNTVGSSLITKTFKCSVSSVPLTSQADQVLQKTHSPSLIQATSNEKKKKQRWCNDKFSQFTPLIISARPPRIKNGHWPSCDLVGHFPLWL